jgi:hypothetical protein
MAADATAGRFRPASSASARVASAAAGLTVAMFGVCGVLLLLGAIRDELANAVRAALEPSHLSVWLKEPPA